MIFFFFFFFFFLMGRQEGFGSGGGDRVSKEV